MLDIFLLENAIELAADGIHHIGILNNTAVFWTYLERFIFCRIGISLGDVIV